jgi:HEAT repeat protein
MGEAAKSALPNLIPLLKSGDRRVRPSAAEVLGNMGESAIPHLI